MIDFGQTVKGAHQLFCLKLKTIYDENARPTVMSDVLCYIVLREFLKKFRQQTDYFS